MLSVRQAKGVRLANGTTASFLSNARYKRVGLLNQRRRHNVSQVRSNVFSVFKGNVFRRLAILDGHIGFSFLNILRGLQGRGQVFLKRFADRFRRTSRLFFVITRIRDHAERRMKQAGRGEVARLISGHLRIIRTNRLLPDQLIGARTIGRNERLVTILNAISEGQENSGSKRQLAVRFRNRIVQGLTTR